MASNRDEPNTRRDCMLHRNDPTEKRKMKSWPYDIGAHGPLPAKEGCDNNVLLDDVYFVVMVIVFPSELVFVMGQRRTERLSKLLRANVASPPTEE
ncbi:hypothetical protein E4U61_007726 [Claviceps capensis]|nr:hypothetical protein E4U61_007726 [Claviceps capensis]